MDNLPMDADRRNWAMKTMLLTMATSVPRPRVCELTCLSPLASSENCIKSNFNQSPIQSSTDFIIN